MLLLNKNSKFIIWIISFLTLILGLTSCKRKENPNNLSATILALNQVNLTRSEWFKHANIYIRNLKKIHNSPPPVDSIKKNANEFLDYAYVLTSAYDNGYDKKKEVYDKVLATSKYMMCQKNGILYKKLIADKIIISEDDINLALNKVTRQTGLVRPNIDRLKDALRLEAEENLYNRYVNEKLTFAKYKIENNILKELSKTSKYSDKLTIDEKSVIDLIYKELLTFQKSDTLVKVKISDFIYYFNNLLPFRKKLRKEEDFEEFAKQMVLNELMYEDAINLKLTSDTEFLAGQLNFKNRTMADLFKQNELFSNINISEIAIRGEYELNKGQFMMPEVVQISIFKFENLMDATYNANILRQSLKKVLIQPIIDTTSIKGLKQAILHTKISYSSSSVFDEQMINYIFSLRDHEISRPSFINNQYIIFIKEREIGKRMRKFEEVRDQIKTHLVKKEENQKLKSYLSWAKKKYTYKSYFTDPDYEPATIVNMLTNQH